ncbi:MAG TPA: histidine kinase, partial [Methylophilaceae bacterium]|nr:histidine kinase [Methylophilaceae bacterium]
MPQIHEEAYVIDAASLHVRHASKGVAAALTPGHGAMAFDQLLDARGKTRLRHFLAEHDLLSTALAEKLAQPDTGQGTASVHFEFKLARSKTGLSILAMRQDQDPAEQEAWDYQGIVAHVPGLIYQVQMDADGRVAFTYLSKACEHLLELAPEALMADASLFMDKLVPEDRASFHQAVQSSAQNLDVFNWEGRIRSEEFGDIKWINLRSSPRKLANGTCQWDGIMSNISQSKQEKALLEESHRFLAERASEMERVKEQERLRIAREIHDDLGGNLTAIKIGLASVLNRPDLDQHSLREKLQHMEFIIDQTFEATHRIASDLRPHVLELGIADALAWQALQFEKQMGLPCRFSSNLHQRLTPDQDMTLFRLCQEALSNIAKHAQATEVTIKLDCANDEVTMLISDNGIGLSPDCLQKPNALGLRGMAERVAALRGSFEILPSNGRGTTKVFKLPVD